MSSSAPQPHKKRERTQNWVTEEKRALLNLVKNHINAIENKKIDTSATALKSLAWRQIHCEFKGKFSTERDITRIREQWRRMKAQARLDINSFVEKVKSSGLEEASKNPPPDLSIDVWRLLQVLKKNESESASEESQDSDPITNLQEILDNLTPAQLDTSFESVKQESSIELNEENPSGESSYANSPVILEKSRGVRLTDEEPINLAHQKRMRLSLESSGDEEEPTLVPDDLDTFRSVEFSAKINEKDIKWKILRIELERAEIQRQAAINDLKTSEIRKQMVEGQAIEYFR